MSLSSLGLWTTLARLQPEASSANALDVLETVGFGDAPDFTRERLTAAGCRLDDAVRVRFPRSLVEDTIARANRALLLHGRRPEHDIDASGSKTWFSTGCGSVRVVDSESRTTRPTTAADVYDFARLVDALDHEALADVGKPFPPQRFRVSKELYVAATREQAQAECFPYIRAKYDAYRDWGQDTALPAGESFESFEGSMAELTSGRFISTNSGIGRVLGRYGRPLPEAPHRHRRGVRRLRVPCASLPVARRLFGADAAVGVRPGLHRKSSTGRAIYSGSVGQARKWRNR